MVFDLFAWINNFLQECFVLTAILFFILSAAFPRLKAQEPAFWNKLNRIGLVLALLALVHTVNLYLMVPTHRVEMIWRSQPYWYSFRIFEMLTFLLLAIILFSKKRREHRWWTISALLLLLSIKFSDMLESWLTLRYYGQPQIPAIHFLLFEKQLWWFSLISVALLFGMSFYLGRLKLSVNSNLER